MIKQENRGMCPSRNRVIPMAKGDWILFLDADDMTAPNTLTLLEQAIETHPEADIHYGDFLACDDDGSNVRPYGSLEDISANPLKALLERNRLGILAALCRTSKIREVNGFDEGMPRSADWDLWIRLAAAGGKFHYLGETIATYRLTEGSASKQFMGMWRALRLIQSNHRALIESTGDRKKIERDHIELLFARDLRYVYGEDEGASWISRRINRTTKVLQLCKKDPNLIPHFMRRTFRKLLHSK
ncbi:MAG: hypothetical protein BGN96_00820 [Bacteroidales bacterium 45-6]|nr:MAG: hypothetical protein BGN96_00820 [Bacteroidales bacterium 45-6]